MSKAEILAELPKLVLEDRREIFERLCELEEHASIASEPSLEERAMLDRELEEYRRDPQIGSSWDRLNIFSWKSNKW